jgi:hypothetical protein
MQDDESIYELVAKELATQPRQGLLIKCMAKCDGDENKGKAFYIETRVDEIKTEIHRKAQQEAEETAKRKAKFKQERLKELQKEHDEPAPVWFIALVIGFVCLIVLLVGMDAL